MACYISGSCISTCPIILQMNCACNFLDMDMVSRSFVEDCSEFMWLLCCCNAFVGKSKVYRSNCYAIHGGRDSNNFNEGPRPHASYITFFSKVASQLRIIVQSALYPHKCNVELKLKLM